MVRKTVSELWFEVRVAIKWVISGKKPDRLVEKFKKKILLMHDGIPRYYFYGLEGFFRDPEQLKYYIKKDILVKSDKYKFYKGILLPIKNCSGLKCFDAYFLGSQGMHLANSFSSEKLTVRISILMLILLFLTILLLLKEFSVI